MVLALDKRRFKEKKEGRLGQINLEMEGRWHTEGSYPVAPEFFKKRGQGHLLGIKEAEVGSWGRVEWA